MNVQPDWEIDAFTKAQIRTGKRHSIVTDLILKLLGLDVSLAPSNSYPNLHNQQKFSFTHNLAGIVQSIHVLSPRQVFINLCHLFDIILSFIQHLSANQGRASLPFMLPPI